MLADLFFVYFLHFFFFFPYKSVYLFFVFLPSNIVFVIKHEIGWNMCAIQLLLYLDNCIIVLCYFILFT